MAPAQVQTDCIPYLDQFSFKAQLIPGAQSNAAYYVSLVEDILTRMCSMLSHVVPQDCRFFVTWDLASGNGDVLHAIKVARIIKKQFPNNYVRFIVNPNASAEKFIRDHGFSAPPIRPVDIENLTRSDLINSGHTGSKWVVFEVATPEMDRIRKDIAHLQYIHGNVTHIRIDEYNGWRYRNALADMGLHSSGLGAVHRKKNFPIGVHIEPALKRVFSSRKERLELLHQLENQEVTMHLLAHNPDNTKLYYAYFAIDDNNDTFYLDRFLETMIKHEAGNSGDISFLVLFPDKKNLSLEERIRALAGGLKGKMCDAGVQEIQVSNLNNADYLSLKVNSTGKIVRLYFIERLSHHDVLLLMQASKRRVLVSGDQSLVEAISMDKIPFYQEQPWKKELTRQIKEVAKIVAGSDSVLSRFFKYVFKEGKRDELFVDEIAACLRDPDLKRQITALNDAICRHYDASSWIIGRISSIFFEQFPYKNYEMQFTSLIESNAPDQEAIKTLLKRIYVEEIKPRNRKWPRVESAFHDFIFQNKITQYIPILSKQTDVYQKILSNKIDECRSIIWKNVSFFSPGGK